MVAKRWSEVGQQMRTEPAKLEAWFVEHWYLDKKWWDQFKWLIKLKVRMSKYFLSAP